MDNITNIENQDLAYDLRQIYAAKVVGEHLIDVAEARKADNFYIWFKALQDVKTVTAHKFKHPKDDNKEYNRLVGEVVELANKYPSTWNGTYKVPVQAAQIDNKLREVEEFLYKKMNEAKMFGEGARIPGL